jgi:hypothetical protein
VLPALAVKATGAFPVTVSRTVREVEPGGTTGIATFRVVLLSVSVGGAELTVSVTGIVRGVATPVTVTVTFAL